MGAPTPSIRLARSHAGAGPTLWGKSRASETVGVEAQVLIDFVPHSPCRSMQAFSKETTSWVEDAKHAMNEELAVAEELSTWMRSQRTKEPGTTRTYTLPSFGQQPAHAAPRAGHRKDLGTVSSADAQRKSQATQPPLPLSIPKRLA